MNRKMRIRFFRYIHFNGFYYLRRMADFNTDVEACLEVLRAGGIILYPTDTVWGIGCDATNTEAVEKVKQLKQRPDEKGMIVLVADFRDVLEYVAAPDPGVEEYLATVSKPTTVIFQNAIGLPENVTAADGSVGIRVIDEVFCKHLIKRLRTPLVSTSANFADEKAPDSYREISPDIIKGVDYVVKYRQEEDISFLPSAVVKMNVDGSFSVIRP
ncbi:MAG: L-threonylcarbamoyladenylate synthase [Chitinophagaceae bacterium]